MQVTTILGSPRKKWHLVWSMGGMSWMTGEGTWPPFLLLAGSVGVLQSSMEAQRARASSKRNSGVTLILPTVPRHSSTPHPVDLRPVLKSWQARCRSLPNS